MFCVCREPEITKYDIYDDLKLKKISLVSMA